MLCCVQLSFKWFRKEKKRMRKKARWSKYGQKLKNIMKFSENYTDVHRIPSKFIQGEIFHNKQLKNRWYFYLDIFTSLDNIVV